jgi:hypothetical protein
MTPLCFISSQRSFPSLVRSPTPPEYRHAAVLFGEVVNELHDDDRFAYARAAEQTDICRRAGRVPKVETLCRFRTFVC